ncbi:hypothetical protein Tco_1216406 [Tanacetum coccineum]
MDFPEFYKDLEAELFGACAKLIGLQLLQLELRLGKIPSRSFRPANNLPKLRILFLQNSSVPQLTVEDMTFDVYALPCFGLVLFVTALFIHACDLDLEPLSFDFEFLRSLSCIISLT